MNLSLAHGMFCSNISNDVSHFQTENTSQGCLGDAWGSGFFCPPYPTVLSLAKATTSLPLFILFSLFKSLGPLGLRFEAERSSFSKGIFSSLFVLSPQRSLLNAVSSRNLSVSCIFPIECFSALCSLGGHNRPQATA